VFAIGSRQMSSEPVASTAPLRVTLVQPSFPQTMIWDSSGNSNRFQQLLALTEQALTNQTDLLIWPEAALPEFDQASYATITNLVRQHHVWMIFNADDVVWRPETKANDDYDVFNSAFLFDPAGNFVKVYHKQKLVIFGEYIPLVRWLPFLKWFTPITGGYTAGDKPGAFEISRRGETLSSPDSNQITIGLDGVSPHRTIKAAPLICFEDMFPQTTRDSARNGADLLVNLTNDGWFGKSSAQWQQAATAAFRAVENNVPLLRCCNTGITCWFDSRGRMRELFRDATGSVYEAGAANWQISFNSAATRGEATYYNRHGDWFGWTCVGITGVLILWHFKPGGKKPITLPAKSAATS